MRGADLLGEVQPVLVQVDGDDLGRAVETGGGDDGEADRAGADDGDGVAGLDLAVLHADLEAGREDVRQQQRGLVGDALRQPVERVVGERDADQLGLGAVDEVAEDPADARRALVGEAVRRVAAAAVGADAAGADAGDDHAVADRVVADAEPTSTTVPTPSCPRIRPSVTAGTSPLRMCRSVPQIVVVSIRTIASPGLDEHGVGDLVPALVVRTVVDECLHGGLRMLIAGEPSSPPCPQAPLGSPERQ